MALVVKDRVRETSTTGGTGTLTLGGAVSGFQSFSVIGDGNTTYYGIADAATGSWEVGLGTYSSSGTTLSRDVVLESSNGGSLVNFSTNIKDVFCTYPAEKAVYADASDVVTVATLAATTVDATNIEVTNIKAKDGTAAGSIADATGVVTLASSILTTTDINGGTIDGTTIGGASAAAGTFTTVAATTGNITTVNATTVDATNVEVTNVKAKDGTASVAIADSTGAVTVSTLLNVDNLRLDGNTISSTNANGSITLAPNGTGQVIVNAGAVGTPIIAPTGDTNTGIFFPAADTMAFTEGGVEVLRINSSAQTVFANSGTAAAPLLTIANSTDTGIYSAGAGTLAISTAGTLACTFSAAGDTNIAGALGVGDAADSTSITINASKTYTSNADRTGLNLTTTITSETLSAARIGTGISNIITVTQAALAFSYTAYGQYNQLYNGSVNDVTSNISTMFGTRSLATNRAAGTVTTMYGSYNQTQNTRSGATTTNMYTTQNKGDVDAGTVTTWIGSINHLEVDGGTVTNAYGHYNRLDRDAGTLTTAYGVFNSFEGTIGTRLGYVNSAGTTIDFGVVGDVNGATASTMRFGIVDTTTPTNSRSFAEFRYEVGGVTEHSALILGPTNILGVVPNNSEIIFNSPNFIYNPALNNGEAARLKCGDVGLATDSYLNLTVGPNQSPVLYATYDSTLPFPSYTEVAGNTIFVRSTGGSVSIIGGGSDNVYLTASSGAVYFDVVPLVQYNMLSGDLFNLAGNNSGLTGTTAVNTLRFTDTDGSTALNQPLGKIEFYTSDASSPGVRVTAFILASALGTSGGGDIRFGTSANAGSVSEAGRITATGGYVLRGGNTAPGGTGITFPATQSASTDANTLDDYEEGTWTPTITSSSGSFTSITYDAARQGRYTKIGNTVYIQGTMRTDAITVGTASGGVRISGLPFTSATTLYGAVCIGYAADFAGDMPSGGLFEINNTFIFLYYRSTSNGATVALDVTDLGTGTNANYVIFEGFYTVA